MARTRAYDREDVLDAAVASFWRSGYEGTSVRDLIGATGLNSRSMYDGFGDKGLFFEAALDRYYDTVLAPVVELLETEHGLTALDAFVDVLTQESSEDGCLFVNTGVEHAAVSAAATVRVRIYRDEMIALFTQKLTQARDAGEFDGDIAQRAMLLSVTLTGFVVSLKWGATIDEAGIALRAVVEDIRRDAPDPVFDP